MATDKIQSERDEHVLTLTINRPDKKNAITSEMYLELVNQLDKASDNDAVRVVVIKGTGGNLTSGNDLSAFQDSPEDFDENDPAFEYIETIATFDKPWITQLEGFAVGVGATMLLHSDLVFSEPEAQIRFPFVDLGVVPEAGTSLLLPKMVGHQKAAEIIYNADFITPQEAEEYGFVNEVIPAENLEERVSEQAEKLASKPPEALQACKRMLRKSYREELVETLREEARLFHERLTSDEGRECMAALAEGREPDFS